MRKPVITLLALFVVTLLVPNTGSAQETYFNQVGLYLNPDGPDGSGRSGTSDIATPVTVYLVMTNPADVQNGNALYPDLNAFECMLNFTPIPNNNLFKLGDSLPPFSINVGDNTDINQGFLEYIVGVDIAHPVPVVDGAAVLITFTLMITTPVRTTITLTPTTRPAIAGEMAFQSVVGQLRVMYPASGSFADPVFEFNGEAVAVETESFGSVKALYR